MTARVSTLQATELVVASAIANATRDYSDNRPSKATDDHHKQAKAAISAVYSLDPTLAAGDALISKLKFLAQEAYGHDHLYETTFHCQVYEELTDAISVYENARDAIKGLDQNQ